MKFIKWIISMFIALWGVNLLDLLITAILGVFIDDVTVKAYEFGYNNPIIGLLLFIVIFALTIIGGVLFHNKVFD